MRTSSFFAPSTSANATTQNSSPSLVVPKKYERTLSRGRILQEIFDTDGGERVFRAFGFELGKRYVSPFRADAQHKNFSVFADKRGRVYFKDFAGGDNTSGNFLQLLEFYGYRDFYSQLEFAATLYGLGSSNQRALLHPTAETKKYPSASVVPQPKTRTALPRSKPPPFRMKNCPCLQNFPAASSPTIFLCNRAHVHSAPTPTKA